ncbi:MAG: SusC/RagA family TonB-linked outer membrane protein [Ferruginibacter sp.]
MKKKFQKIFAGGIRPFLYSHRFNLRVSKHLACLLLALLFTCGYIDAQQITVRGKVVESGTLAPLSGAAITVKGKTGGVISGAGGVFNIKAAVGDQLIIDYTGYASNQVNITGANDITVTLNVSAQTLNDVVVVGYGTQKRKDLTGAISSVKLENSPLALLPNVNLLDALKGSMPGLNIGAVNGAGSNPGISIRGQNSISASNTPLIILDGAIFLGSLNELNPADFASVDVLKDASSTAVYGSLAANGVILLTTKRGKTEKPTISLAVTGGIQTYTNRPDMLSTEGYIQLKKERFQADNPTSVFDINVNLNLYELDAYKKGITVDWFDEVTEKNAPFKNATLSVSGATSRTNYYISGSYMDQHGIVVGDQFHKYSVLAKMETRITDWLRTGFNFGFTNKNADGIPADLRNGTISSPYGFKNVHDRGTIAPGFENFPNQMERYPQGQTTTTNGLWVTQQYNEDRNQNYRSISFARVDVPFIKGLSYTFNYSINRWEGHSANFQHENMFINTMLLSELSNFNSHLVDATGNKTNSTRTDWYLNHLINYKKIWGDHNFDLTLLEEEQSRQNTNMFMSAKDFSGNGTSVLGTNSLELGNAANYAVTTDFSQLRQMASMARLNYSYKSKYLANFSIRQDGYSGYAEGHKYGAFRAGAVAWVLSEEPYFKQFKYLDNLKLRLSYGENGNPSVGAYATFPNINSTQTILLGGTTQRVGYLGNLANKNLDWEKTTALNIGLDFGIFKNKLSGSFNAYNSNTTDLLLTRAIPIINGFTTVLDNIGKVNNKGIEVQLNLQSYSRKEFTWNTGFIFSINRNKIVSLYGLDADKNGKEDDDIANSRFIGKSLGANNTYVMDGIIQKDDAEFIAVYGGKPGDVKFRDLNNDGKIDPKDRTIVGYDRPNFTMTLSNTLEYKGVQLYFLLNFLAGGGKDNWYMGNNVYAYFPNALSGGTVANWLNKPYWSSTNPSNTVTSLNYNNSAYNYGFPHSKQFVRLQDVALSYDIPSAILGKAHISSLKVYASAKNLLTFTKWEGLDPETATEFAGNGSGGFPVFKIITVGINASF